MCYSAQIWADYRKFQKVWGSEVDIKEFVRLYWQRQQDGGRTKIPKGMDAPFLETASGELGEIHAMISDFNDTQAAKFEQELFAQSTRLNAAARALQVKVTKKAQEDVRIATNKITAAREKLSSLRRVDPEPDDNRIFPGNYGLVMVSEGGRRVVKPMRYQCRMPGWTEAVERQYPGTYNARRDKLASSWKELFGYQHGLMVADVFYENVEGPDGKNQVLAFAPRTVEPMLIACLWNRSPGYKGAPDLLSFAAITDDPEPEVADAGHDRTIINIKPEHIDVWLNPDPAHLDALYAIFDDKQHPFYEHRLAA